MGRGKHKMKRCFQDKVDNSAKSFAYRVVYPKVMLLNGLLLVSTIFAGILVGVGACRPRYRHHALFRCLFHGATTLSSPIVSYVISRSDGTGFNPPSDNALSQQDYYYSSQQTHSALLLVWACLVQLVQTVGISNGATVAADEREAGRNTGLPVTLLLQAIWVSYLLVLSSKIVSPSQYKIELFYLIPLVGAFALIFARLLFKCYAFQKARRSLALKRNPRLIVGYMKQLLLQDVDENSHQINIAAAAADAATTTTVAQVHHHGYDNLPPPLIVMGEETQQVEKKPHGYSFRRMPSQDDAMNRSNCDLLLVTIDKIWQLEVGLLVRSVPQLKDLCLSFALHKILRCRFADYTATDTGCVRAHNFLWQLLRTSNGDPERLLGIFFNELSFLHDYYYSSLPISYSKLYLPVLSIVISLFTISYGLLAGILVTRHVWVWRHRPLRHKVQDRWGQIYIRLFCQPSNVTLLSSDVYPVGNLFYDIVPIFLVLAIVVLAEARDIASYICSNWTKVTLFCHSLNNATTWQRYPGLQKCVAAVLRYQCKAVNPMDDKMRQLSILELNFRSRKTITACLLRPLHLLGKNKNVKVPIAVKAGIINALRSNNGQLSNGIGFLRRRRSRNQQEDHGGQKQNNDDDFLWACTDGEGTTDVILTWHIATSILEKKLEDQQRRASSDNQIAATHLSRYCAYLLDCWPEFLPDDDKWSKSLYGAVSKDSMRVLAMASRGGSYDETVALLTEKSKHEVVKNGARLGKQLVQLEDEAAAWSLLAGVWSEMILYVAPSENLNAHSDAIARGGELITVVWALLMHLGIYTRPTGASPANSV